MVRPFSIEPPQRLCGESYFRSSIHRDGQRTQETRHFFWRTELDPLRRRVSSPPLPDPDRVQRCRGQRAAPGPAEQSLQRGPDVARVALPDDPRVGTDRDNASCCARMACFSTSPVCRVIPMRRHSGGFCCAWLPPPCQSCGRCTTGFSTG